jgi:hypothetical protein
MEETIQGLKADNEALAKDLIETKRLLGEAIELINEVKPWTAMSIALHEKMNSFLKRMV